MGLKKAPIILKRIYDLEKELRELEDVDILDAIEELDIKDSTLIQYIYNDVCDDFYMEQDMDEEEKNF